METPNTRSGDERLPLRAIAHALAVKLVPIGRDRDKAQSDRSDVASVAERRASFQRTAALFEIPA